MGTVLLLAGTVRWQCWAACTVSSNTGHTAHAAEWWRRAWVVEDSQNCEGSNGASVLRVVPPAYTQSELMLTTNVSRNVIRPIFVVQWKQQPWKQSCVPG